MSKKRIALHLSGNRYNADAFNTSTSKIWSELSKDFDEYIVFARNKNKSYQSVNKGKIKLILIPSIFSRMFEFFFTSFISIPFILKYKPKIIILQCPVYGGIAASFSKIFYKKSKLFFEFHGEHYFQPSSSSFSRKIEHCFYKFFTKISINYAWKIRALSNEMKLLIQEKYKKNNICVVPPRVNLDIFYNQRKKFDSLPENLKIVTVGQMSKNKNHIGLIQKLADSNLDYRLNIIGNGPEFNACKSKIKALGLENKVSLHGNLQHSEISRIFKSCDIYIHFSKSEALPRAILEAMASGLVVIALKAGFIDHIIEDEFNGYILNSEEALLDKLNYLKQSNNLDFVVNNASRDIQNNYNADEVYASYRKELMQ